MNKDFLWKTGDEIHSVKVIYPDGTEVNGFRKGSPSIYIGYKTESLTFPGERFEIVEISCDGGTVWYEKIK